MVRKEILLRRSDCKGRTEEVERGLEVVSKEEDSRVRNEREG